ncbi:MAG: ATP-binding protein [Alphaproteobacteria bacterium]|nr:ATP-binding protein [Alphaproteobacteria bacterium]
MLLDVKNDVQEIDRVFARIKEFCCANNISEKKCFDILIIVDELATNIVSYAFDDDQEHTFTIMVEKESENGNEIVHLRLSDGGIPFDPLKNPGPDTEASLENRKVGGLGIFFVKQLSDHIAYARIEGKNQLDVFVSLKEEE